MKSLVQQIVADSINTKQIFFERHLDAIVSTAATLAEALSRQNKILLFGNGGSAADCQHIAAEFVNRFQMERPPLAALALTTDTSVITSIGNDYGFDQVFSKQIQALGKKGDIALGISTSGNSNNVLAGIRAAARAGLTTIGFSGPGGTLPSICDIAFSVNAGATARIQEVHILLGHILCDLAERKLYNA